MNSFFRYAFYVSGNASRLLKICESYPQILKETYLVINDEGPNEKLKNVFDCHNKCYIEFSYKEMNLKGASRNDFISTFLFKKLEESKIDYLFSFGSKILKGDLLCRYKNRIINFHPSILPMYPGTKSIDQALSANSFLLGNTAHFVDEGVDTGPIIMQSIKHSKDCQSYEDILSLQLPMIFQIFCWLNEDRLSVIDNIVFVKNANYRNPVFYPQLEINYFL